MQRLRDLLAEHERFPVRRTWERRLKALPETLSAQIGCAGRHLLELIQPWATSGRAVALDSTVLLARGGVWHHKHREQGEVPAPVRFVLGDRHYNTPDLREFCAQADRLLVSTRYGRSPHTDDGVACPARLPQAPLGRDGKF